MRGSVCAPVIASWMRNVGGPAVFYLLGFALLSHPALGSFSTHFFGDGWDGLQNAWNLWWVRRALTELHVSPWFTPELFHPDGVTLLGHTLGLFNGLLGIPLAWFLTPVQVYNTIVVFAFVASGTTLFLLARALGSSYASSLFAGAAFTFGSYHWAHADGHMNLISLEWIPLFLLAWIRWLDRPGLGRALLAAGALWLVKLCDYYYAVFSAVMGAALLVAAVRARPERFRERGAVRSLLVFAAIGFATSGAHLARLFRASANDPMQGGHDPLEFSLDLYGLFVPGGHWRFAELTSGFWETLPGVTVESSVYLGWTVILPAAYAWWSRKRDGLQGLGVWLVLAVGFGVMALGPQLQIWGITFPGVPMPYALLERVLPPVRLTGVPVRMASMVLLCVALLAARGLPGFRRHVLRSRAASALFLVVFALEIWPSPLPLTRPDVPDYFEKLRELPPGAVHGPDVDGADVLYQQTLFRKPMTLGSISRQPLSLAGRKSELSGLVAEGRAEEMMRHFRVRYLIALNPSDGAVPRGLKPVFVGGERTIYVLAEDPLPDARRASR
jgi:hypothetical protein